MSNKFVRSSKYRHIFGTVYKREKCYDGIKISKHPNESNMSSVNKKFLAVVLEAQGGGAFLVAPLTKVGRFDINYPKVSGHKSKVLDVQWNPFDDNEIASCSEDCTIKIWTIPEEGLVGKDMNADDAKLTLSGHQKKVTLISWHPCAKGVLLSCSMETLFVWNVEASESPVIKMNSLHTDMIQSICWSYNGSAVATTCKDKKLRIIDPRKQEVLWEVSGHDGTKPSRVVFCGDTNKLFTTGYSRMSDRQYALWNPQGDTPNKAICMTNIDTGSGVNFPFYDEGTSVVYLVGKGDTQIKYFEVGERDVFYLSMFQAASGSTQRAVCTMPKRELDYMKCETMRFYSLKTKGNVEPISMTVPRKSEMFQDDIFPPCAAGEPSLTADEWLSGVNRNPKRVQFTEDGVVPLDEPLESSQYSVKKVAAEGKKEPSVLKRFGSPQPDDARPTPVTLDEYRKAWPELVKENEELRKRIKALEGK